MSEEPVPLPIHDRPFARPSLILHPSQITEEMRDIARNLGMEVTSFEITCDSSHDDELNAIFAPFDPSGASG